ncbi:MAG: ABC transporter substrate-binding protein [Thermomicrobiales bacterium]
MVRSDAELFVVDDVVNGRITRRDLVRWGAALGLSGPAIAGLQTSADASAAAQNATPGMDAGGAADTGLLTAPESNPKRGGTLRTAFGVTTTSYDIHQGGNIAVLTHMYDGLVRFNPLDGLQTIIPSLAKEWEVSDDSLAYTFHLRDGVTFHDGEPLTADDVVATFSRVIAPPENVVSVMRAFFRSVESVESVDPLTVRFNLSEPQADLMPALAAPFSVIYSKKALDENNQDLRGVVAPGTGPYVYEEYQQDERWILTRNPDYWNAELPYVDQLELLHVATWSDRGTAVLTGQADFSWNVSRETFDEGQRRDDVAAKEVPSVGCYTVIINTQREPFSDPRVRRAMYLVLNRQALIQAFQTQETIALTRWVSHANEYAMSPEEIAQLPGYRADKTEDIETAKNLLAEAGYPDGFNGIELLSASVPPHAEIMAPAIQDMLSSTLNIQAEIRVTERSLLFEEESSGSFDLVLDTPTIAISDFSAVGNLYFTSDGSQNFGTYANPEFDELLHAADLELDQARRGDILRQIEDVLDQDPPWLLVGWTFHLPMWQAYVKGVNMEERTQSVWGRLDTAWLDQ